MSNLTHDRCLITYNGFSWPVEAKSKIDIKTIPDQADRTVRYNQYTLTVSGWIIADLDSGDTTTDMVSIRQQLTQQGQRLQVTDFGFGDIDLNNPAGTVWDVQYGPRPKVVVNDHLGDGRAWHVTWTCEFVLVCEDNPVYQNRLLQFCYEWSTVVDKAGYSVRTITGTIEVPAHIVPGTNGISDNAEDGNLNYWETRVYNNFPMIQGFQRSTSRKLSLDKRTLSFTITDEEMQRNALMEGCTEWSGTQELSSGLGPKGGWGMWVNAISATYKLSRDRPKTWAWQLFLNLLDNRLGYAPKIIDNQTVSPIPLSFRVSDELNSDTVHFSFAYKFPGSLKDFAPLSSSGMWQLVPNTDPKAWQASVTQTAAHARGNAKLRFKNSFDGVISICDPTQKTVLQTTGAQASSTSTPKKATPPAGSSWLAFASFITFVGRNGLAIHQPLGAGHPQTVPSSTSDTKGYVTPFDQGPAGPAVIQYRTPAQNMVILEGYAVRVGFEISPPSLDSVGGANAYLYQPYFRTAVTDSASGVPIYSAAWRNVYVLDRCPDSTPLKIPAPEQAQVETGIKWPGEAVGGGAGGGGGQLYKYLERS